MQRLQRRPRNRKNNQSFLVAHQELCIKISDRIQKIDTLFSQYREFSQCKTQLKQQTETKMTTIDDDMKPAPAFDCDETKRFIDALYDLDMVRLKELAYQVPINKQFISIFVNNERLNVTPIQFILRGNSCEYVSFRNDENKMVELCKMFIDCGADVNLVDSNTGFSPLASILEYALIFEDEFEIIKLLLENGAIIIGEFDNPPNFGNYPDDLFDISRLIPLLNNCGVNCMKETEFKNITTIQKQTIIF
jgi:hypothetical protein